MKSGTIVVCLPVPSIHPTLNSFVKWLPKADEKTEYMIRKELNNLVIFEEGIIGEYNNTEIGYPKEFVREVLPAEDISEMIKEICNDYQVIEI